MNAKRNKLPQSNQKPEEHYHLLSRHRGFIKIAYRPALDADVFSMAYGRCDKFCQDNCRILGYDTRHGHDPVEYGPCHRHYLGNKKPFPLTEYSVVFEKFCAQWQAIDTHFENHESLDSFDLAE